MDNSARNLMRDAGVIFLSILLAIILIRTDVLTSILNSTKEVAMLGSFIAGIFFTSIFTTVPAMVTLGEIAQTNSVWMTALFGGLGAAIGDMVIFRFVRDRFSEDLDELTKNLDIGTKLKKLARLKWFKVVSFFIGAIIIASPLPDEIGVGLLGLTKTNAWLLALIAFIFNFIGILLIGLAARALLL